MKNGTNQNHFSERLSRIREERAELRQKRVQLDVRDEELIRLEARLTEDSFTGLVRIDFLLHALSLKRDGFERLRNNPERGFPDAIYGIDGLPRWNWEEVQEWIARLPRG